MSSPDAQALTQKVSGTLAEVASQKDAVAQKVTGTLSQAASQRDAVVNSVVQGVQDQGPEGRGCAKGDGYPLRRRVTEGCCR